MGHHSDFAYSLQSWIGAVPPLPDDPIHSLCATCDAKCLLNPEMYSFLPTTFAAT